MKKHPFDTTAAEKVIAWLSLPVAFCYVQFLWSVDAGDDQSVLAAKILLAIFVAGFIAAGEVLHQKEKLSFESILWLLCECAVFVAFAFSLGHVWKGFHLLLFLHLFAPYWLLTRADRLSEGHKTSHMFFWDGLTAFFILPFKNFHLLISSILSTFTGKPGDDHSAGVSALVEVGLQTGFPLAGELRHGSVGRRAFFEGKRDLRLRRPESAEGKCQ